MLKQSERLLEELELDKEIEDINEAIELFNINELFETGTRHPDWDDETYIFLKEQANFIPPIIGRFFSRVDEHNYKQYHQKVAAIYLEDFWTLFEKYKVFKRVFPASFSAFLKMKELNLSLILKYKKIVEKYDQQLAQALRTSEQTARILIAKFMEENEAQYYLPHSLSPDEYEATFQRYVESKEKAPLGVKTSVTLASFPTGLFTYSYSERFCTTIKRQFFNFMLFR